MTNDEFDKLGKEMLHGLQIAIQEDYQRKAKLGQKVVIADKNGKPKLYSARYLLRKKSNKS